MIEWQELETPEWSFSTAVARLGIPWHQTPFPPGAASHPEYFVRALTGDLEGEASVLGVWVSPIAEHPLRSAVHELAHVILKHIDLPVGLLPEEQARLVYAAGEVEAETVALGVLQALHRPEAELAASYEYINTWLPRRGLRWLNHADTLDLAVQVILKYGRPSAFARVA
jgi:hypothetical protein